METMENTWPAGKMQRIWKKISKIFQQTCALLWKNILRVWRMKMETFQEWITMLILISTIYFTTRVVYHSPRHEIPYKFLGRLDDPAFNATGVKVVYTPATKATKHIMDKVASDSAMMGIKPEEMKNEQMIEKDGFRYDEFIGVVFKDDSSYTLRFRSYRIVHPNDFLDQIETCYNYSSSYCNVPSYWNEGFLSLQASIDAIMIEVKTNHSVWEEMKSISGVYLKSALIKPLHKMGYIGFIFGLIVCFSPHMYFLSIKVIREKKKLKVLMKAMGLQDIAFWLSWSLLYTVYIAVPASLMTAITLEVFYEGDFTQIFFFYFFYGIASIHFYFMLSSLLKQPNITSFVGFVLQVIFGCLGFLTFFEMLPPAFEWIFSLMSSFICAAGISEIIKSDKHTPAFTPESNRFLKLYIILSLDSVLYMLLAIYFDKVLPGKYGVQYPPSFFLKPSYWFQHKSRSTGEGASNGSSRGPLGSAEEPMPPEFIGKEAIRINNIDKAYKRKDKRTEALKGLSLNVYEGQITALLGHSGSGKTTLLNVLSGFVQPSAGSAMIYNYKVSEIEDMEAIQAIVGVCPQSNLHFEALTVKENLRTFAHIKGIPMNEVEQEVKKVLTALDLTDLQDVHPNTLTMGQKRKLSLGIAILGNPKVLLLDEPTAGLDPSSRQHVWHLLKEDRADRVTLFTTQCMDEADVHADRKAFLSNGRLQCVGSSLYLKRKWGVGYHLRMQVNDLCDPDMASSLVRQYIPDAVFRGQKGKELCYMLPMENTDALPDLFSHLESSLLQGVVNYEINRTTLEDVFLKLEGEEGINQEDDGASGNEHIEDGDCFNLEEMDRSLLTLWERGRATVSGTELWRQQARAVARVRFLKLKHDGKLLRSLLLFFGVFILPLFIIFIGFQLTEGFNSFELTASLYFVPNEEKTHIKSTNLLIFNDTGSDIEDFIHALKIQKIVPEIAVEENITSMPQYNGAIRISREGKRYQYTIMCSAEPINCFPVLMNILSNTFLRLLNSTERIRIWSDPFPHIRNLGFMHEVFYRYLIFMLLLIAGLPPHFAMTSMDDYKIKARSQLRLAGLFPSAYWCGQALVDVPLYWALVSLMFGTLALFCQSSFLNATVILSLIVCIIGYGISLVLHIYVIAFIFRNGRSNRYCWSFIIVLISLIFYMFSDREEILSLIFSALIPVFPLLGWLVFFVPEPYYIYMDEQLELWSEFYVPVFAPYIHCAIFVLLLCFLETRYGGAATRCDPIFRMHRGRAVARPNKDQPGEEAAEVKAERERVRRAAASRPQREDPVIVNSARKEYEDTKACWFLKKKKKVAVKNLSFAIKKGEVLGLLGPNGAGKSTTMNMISGDVTLTAGEVLIQATDAPSPGQASAGFLGRCPQENPLWPELTVQEHLEVYSAVRGMRSEDVAADISCIAEALELQMHLKTEVRRLSAGEVRKVSFVLSMLGDPTVLLWDEPSVGMDPKGQRRMRKAIQTALKSKQRGAVLSTHHLDEALATCDRVAVLVSGQLRYLGPVEDLRREFGQSYYLEVARRDAGRGGACHAEVLRLFPTAARQESSSSLLVYKIPTEDVLPLSRSFAKLEAAKKNRRLEDYSLSLRTLQQVFVDLTADSEEHDQDAASSEAQDQRPLYPKDV